MMEGTAGVAKLKILLLNLITQITAMKKTEICIRKHFNVRKIVEDVQLKLLLRKEEKKQFQEELTQLLEDSLKLFKDSERIQHGMRSLFSIFSQSSRYEANNKLMSPNTSRISFSDDVDRGIDDIISSNGNGSTLTHSTRFVLLVMVFMRLNTLSSVALRLRCSMILTMKSTMPLFK